VDVKPSTVGRLTEGAVNALSLNMREQTGRAR
jgi:hypothetical protein